MGVSPLPPFLTTEGDQKNFFFKKNSKICPGGSKKLSQHLTYMYQPKPVWGAAELDYGQWFFAAQYSFPHGHVAIYYIDFSQKAHEFL